MKFWDKETVSFSGKNFPEWLKIDPVSGVLEGQIPGDVPEEIPLTIVVKSDKDISDEKKVSLVSKVIK